MFEAPKNLSLGVGRRKKSNRNKPEKKELFLDFVIKKFSEKKYSDIKQLEKRIEKLEREGAPEKEIELLKLKLEGSKIYQNDFIKNLDKVLKHKFIIEQKEGIKEEIVLGKIIEHWLKKFSKPEYSNFSLNQKASFQKEFLKNLVHSISKIPPAVWSIDFEQAIKTNTANCQCCSTLTGLILEATQQITDIKDVEYGFPVDHAVNIVTLADDEICLIDSRKGIIEELTPDNSNIENYRDLKIYKIKNTRGRRIYKIIPVLPLEKGVLTSYLGNLCAAYICIEEKIPEAFKKYIKPEELKELRKIIINLKNTDVKQIYKKNNLSEEKISRLIKIRELVNGELENYKKTEEFVKEIDRCRKIYSKRE